MLEATRRLEETMRSTPEMAAIAAQTHMAQSSVCLVPLLIRVCGRCTAFDFIAPLYHNLAGVLVMTACMIFYGSMILLGDRLVQINV